MNFVLRWAVAGLSPRRPGLDPKPHVGFVVDEVALENVLSQYFGFLFSLFFGHCSILILIHTLLLLAGRTTENWEP
jgi:hypothetical protein